MGYLSAKQINHLKDLQKSNYAGRRSFQGMSLRVVGLADAVIEFAELMEQCTVKVRSEENIKVEKIESKQAIKETRIEQSWKKWLIGGSLLFLFLFILVYLILKRYKIL